MNYTEIIYEVSERIATITMNRPEKLNAWTGVMESEYKQAMADVEKRDDVRVIVVTGAGKGFCAGADMNMLSAIGQGKHDVRQAVSDRSASGNGSVRADYSKKYSWPLAVEKPIIAAINGAAAGLGLVNALFCDLRIAADTAKFSTAFARRGLIAEHGISWMLPRIVGIDHAIDLLLSGRTILAPEAFAMGLVTKVVPAAELMPTVRAYAKELATWSSPRSTGVMKRQVYAAMFSDLGTAIDVADEEMLKSLVCDDFKEGVKSFIEKREPAFTGK